MDEKGEKEKKICADEMDIFEKDHENELLAIESHWRDRFNASEVESKSALEVTNDAAKKDALQMRIRLLQALQQASRIAHFLSLGCEDGGPLQDTNKPIVQVAPLDFQTGE